MLRVGVDVGGTFTDIFVYDEESGQTVSAKVPTTPENQAIGVIESVEAANVALGDVGFPVPASGRLHWPQAAQAGGFDHFTTYVQAI